MVQVEPPDQPIAVGPGVVDSEAITEESVQNPGPLSESTAASGFEPSPATQPRQPGDTAAPPLDWQSERTARTRQIGLVIAISLCSFLAAALLFGWFVHAWRKNSPPVTATDPAGESESAANAPAAGDAPAVDSSSAPQLTGSAPNDDAPPERSSPEEDDSAQANADSTGGDQSGGAASKQAPADAVENRDRSVENTTGENAAAADPSGSQESLGSQGSTSADDQPAAAAGDSSQAVEDTTPAIPSDLLPESPPTVALGREDSEATESPATDESSQLQDLPPGLRKFTPFLGSDGGQPDNKPTLAAPQTLEEVDIDRATDDSLDPMMIANPPEPIDLDRALAIQMALDTQGYPLTDLVLLISQITGVPIQIDWVSFDLANIDVTASVQPPGGGWKSAAEVLDAVAASSAAEVRRHQSLLELTVDEPTFQEKFKSLVRLDDFANRRSAENLLNRFLRDAEEPPEPSDDSVWQPPGQTRQERQLAALAVDALRRMRGIEPKVPDRRYRRWAMPAAEATGGWPLLSNGDSGPQYDVAITIAELLRRTARRNQATCLVNWHDVRRRRVSPEQLTLPYTGDPAAEMLKQTLEPFGLQVRKVDDRHWWVGTEATYDRLPVLVWTQPLGDEHEPLRRRLDRVMAGVSVEHYRFAYDSTSDRALLLLPRFILAQFDKIREP